MYKNGIMVRRETDLPFGDAFSPNQLHTDDDDEALSVLLDIASRFQGDEDGFDEQIRETFFPDHDDTTRAKNVRLGMKPSGYGILDDNFRFTELGTSLYELRHSPEEMHDVFAQHILTNLHGLKGIQIIDDLLAQGEKPTNGNIKEEFRRQYGFHIDVTSNHWSQMRAWMSKAGIMNTGTYKYDIDREKVEKLAGVESRGMLALDSLTDEQQAFLRALALIDPADEVKSRTVRKVAENAYGVKISQSNISRLTLDPLEEIGYITWQHVSGKPNLVSTTEKFDADILKPVLDDLSARSGIPRRVLRQSFSEIDEKLDADSIHEKGLALETLAVKIGRLIGLEFVGWRVRGTKTGGSEVDVVMDQLGATFNRWQIQCKNIKSQLDSKYIAREVGIASILQTNTVLMIARGGISSRAEQFANQVMGHGNLSIIFLTGEEIEALEQDTINLDTALRGQVRKIHNLKKLDPGEIDDAGDTDLLERESAALEEFSEELNVMRDSQEALDEFYDPEPNDDVRE